MQNPEEDTEWNDILRQMKILPPKQEVKQEEILVRSFDDIHKRDKLHEINYQLDELEDAGLDEDEEERKVLEKYKQQRLAELKAEFSKKKFGSLREVSKSDWVTEVNEEDPSVYVIIHIAKQGIEMCSIMDRVLRELAQKFMTVKFLRGESELCIPNYPDRNLPSLFIYKAGEMAYKLIGASSFGGARGLTANGLEWNLAKLKIVNSDLDEFPEGFRIKTIKGKDRDDDESSDGSD